MNRKEQIENMSKLDNPNNERLELAKHLQGLSEREYNYTVNTVDNDRRIWGNGAIYGAHWSDNHKFFTQRDTEKFIILYGKFCRITDGSERNLTDYINKHWNDE